MLEWSNGSNDTHRMLLVTIMNELDGTRMFGLSHCSRPIGAAVMVVSWEYR